jgi:hypothetical protein
VSVHHRHVVDGLSELSDEGVQRTVWLGAGEGQMSPLTEARCPLFDDNGLAHALARQGVYRPDIDRKLRILGWLLREIDDSQTPGEVVDDPMMATVREAATHALSQVKRGVMLRPNVIPPSRSSTEECV